MNSAGMEADAAGKSPAAPVERGGRQAEIGFAVRPGEQAGVAGQGFILWARPQAPLF